ncbi:hypothetical protein ASPWEDRAFT_29875 [Aspergillus wentii DTO 134E9]|uniref:Linalool dehydratase/isomerase domain-containing protein n=1 Tax=Aspergillus wentii DTO 134E9 TaxID=1073089 RepID=A0A1L9RCX4_ASPWE|nr:uncharacterized protein ASPWEDRAFT_29875 [Aspergillus wentii DTO 134E9]KAI9924306.1 hypothetical protein MW887_007256 [Aspergillus wentii]OJJ32727.1 hypothetical protein ASPWEDRAFT_29875 [Aspergillus wentii DTO 134E9]
MTSTSTPGSNTLPVDLSKYPKLSHEQAGHLRHFYNLSAAIDGDWPHMGSQEPAQEFLDAYRYQLATMAYAAGVTHYHRMPAMRGLFKPLIRRLIHKMLRREVWGYWYLTSQSGIRLDPDLKELRKPWADPVVRENIMYSGHLLLMTSLYGMLFDDDEFEKPGSLVFRWDPLFWGMGSEEFSYDNRSLQGAIIAEMERNNWVGVCCEPNLVFVACNQFPIIAMRYNDVRDGTNVVEDILGKYTAALEKHNMISRNDLYKDWVSVKQGHAAIPKNIGFTAWAAAFMNTWNSEFVKSGFTNHAVGFITNIDGEIELQHPMIAGAYRAITTQSPNQSKSQSQILHQAREYYTQNKPTTHFPYKEPTFGYVAKWLSELGKTTELSGLLAYADNHLHPTWENGGLYYPRNDAATDHQGRWTHMDPFSGNAAIGYARLNVENGQKKMWDSPWTREVLGERPWVDGIEYSMGVDALRGVWDDEVDAMVVTLREWAGRGVGVDFKVKNLSFGRWAVYQRHGGTVTRDVVEGREVQVKAKADASEEVDVVVIKAN